MDTLDKSIHLQRRPLSKKKKKKLNVLKQNNGLPNVGVTHPGAWLGWPGLFLLSLLSQKPCTVSSGHSWHSL